MRDKQVRTATAQWLIPTIMLLIAMIAMFIDFYTTSSEAAQEQVEKGFIFMAEGYASQMAEKLTAMQQSGKTAAAIMGKHSKRELGLAEEAVEALAAETAAYMVIMSDLEGNGINQDGEWISVLGTDYYGDIQGGNEKFLYLEDDGFSGRSAFLVVLSIDKWNVPEETKGMILMYYPIEEFRTMVKNGELGGNAFFIITDISGRIMEKSNGLYTSFEGDNLWKGVSDDNAVKRAKVRMQNRNNGIINIVDNREEYKLVYVPVGVNDWYVAMGVKQPYVRRMQNQAWNNTKIMLYKLILIICIFFAIIVTLNIISRVRSNEQTRNLADKADTDLLTDLYNKAATERKIKEYIEEHPNEQAVMFLLDIDNFKRINDTMGHAFGDEVLRTLGHDIRGEFRVSDIIGRTGGDEFIIFLKGIKDDAFMEQEAKRMAHFFSTFQAGEYVKYSATASIGAAVFPKDAKDFDGLYKAADKALYKAKERGKNQLVFFEDAQ